MKEMLNITPITFMRVGNFSDNGGTPLLASKQARAHKNAVETSEQPRK